MIRQALYSSLVLLCLTVISLAESQVKAEIDFKVSGLFHDHMVVQRETDAPIWGWGKPGEQVSIRTSWNRKTTRTEIAKDGSWKTTIATPKAGGPYEIEIKSEDDEVELKNVLSGEVWICSGQSNMQWKMRGFGLKHFEEDVKKAKYPEIRLCLIPQVLGLEPQKDVKASWAVCSPQSVLGFSAVAYFFGSELHQELDVPIGLISTNWGGSSAEAWVSEEVLRKEFSEFKPEFSEYEKHLKKGDGLYENRAKDKPKGLSQTSPAVLYNTMIEPLLSFAMRGVVWYQGESNVKNPEQYRTLFPAVIQDWRSRWGQGDFPFYYVQIAPFVYKQEKIPVAFLREAQLMALSEPNTGMVVTMDIGDAANIHPKEKKPVGERLALLALARTYGKEDLVDSGPLYESQEIEGENIRIHFTSLGTGLASSDDEALTHFTIAGRNKKFYPADAVIDGDTIVVRSKKVPRPAAVRFGWGNADEPNLMNKEGLPSSSFRTDDWKIK